MTLGIARAKLAYVKRYRAVLLVSIAATTLAAGMACGGGEQPQDDSRSANSIDGVWSGTYMAYDGSQNGSFCASFEQDNGGITGDISFNGGAPSEIGGVITANVLSVAYGAYGAALATRLDPPSATNIAAGGTMNGTVNGDGLSGTWIAASSVDVHGDWTATRHEAGLCK